METATLLQRLRGLGGWWRGLSPATRGLSLGLVVAGVFSVFLAVYLNRPDYVALGQFDPRDAGAITAKLTAMKVPYQPGPDGQTLLVPKVDLFTARLAVAQSGVAGDGTTGYELFDKPQFGATELEQQVALQRALEGELTRALLRLAPVERAQVRLALPPHSAFVRDQQPPSAAVLLQLRQGAQLSAQEIGGLVRFVAAAVPELTPANVTVIDDHGRLLNDAADLGPGGGDGSSPVLARDKLELEKTLEGRVLSLLEPVFGRGNVVAKVSLDLDTSKRTTETNTLLPGANGQPLVRSSEETKTTTTPGAAPTPPPTTGPAGIPQYLGSSGATAGSTDSTHTITNYDYSTQHQLEVSGPGAVRKVTAGVLINGLSGLSAAEVDQVRQTVAAALGAATADVTVNTMSFRGQPVTSLFQPEPAPATAALPGWLPWAVAIAVLALGLLLIALRRRPAASPLPTGWPASEAPAAGPGGEPLVLNGHAGPALGGYGPHGLNGLKGANGQAPGGANGLGTAGLNGHVANGHAASGEAASGQPGSTPAAAAGPAAGDSGHADIPDLPPEVAESLDEMPDPEQTEALLASLLGADSVVLANPKVREKVEKAVKRRPQEAAAILSAWISERRR